MLRLAAFALLVAVASASVVVKPRGPVEGVTPCGSQGTVLEIRVTDCTRLPCQINIGSTYDVEVDFIPSRDHERFNVKATVIKGGVETEYINQDVEQAVSAGTAYTVTYPIAVTDAFGTGPIEIRIELSGSGVLELCGIASAVIN